MKLVIASDLHGSATATRELVDRIEEESPDRVALLGDLLYHGPRNNLPEGHAPREVARILNGFAGRIVAVRGNCDAEVDQMVLDFPCMADYALLADGPHTLFLTHGHVAGMTPNDLPDLPPASAFLYGHTHVKKLARVAVHAKGGGQPATGAPAGDRREMVLANPGSASLPKDGSASFAVYADGRFFLKTLAGETLSELSL